MYIKTYLKELAREKERHPCYLECEKHFENTSSFSELYNIVCYTMGRHLSNQDNNEQKFSADYLLKVVRLFKLDVGNFIIQRNILEAILCYAKNNYLIESPKVPNLFELKRDKPTLTPSDLIKARLSQRIYALLDQEAKKPNIHLSQRQQLGRLALFLYLKEGVRRFNDISKVLSKYSYNYIADCIILSDVETEKPVTQRYVLTDISALFFMQLLYNYKDLQTRQFSGARLLTAVNDFLSHVADDAELKYTRSRLRLCRKIYYTLHYSPSEAYFYTGTLPSALLPANCFTRVLTGRAIIRENEASNLTKSTGITLLRNQLKKGLVTAEHYQSIESCQIYLKKTYALIKEIDRSITTKNNILSALDIKLKDKTLQANGCLWLMTSWTRSLLSNGGLGKVSLRTSTIIDYVSTLAIPFFDEFLEHDLFQISGPDWAEKLNLVAEKINSPTRRNFVYFFAHYLEEIEFISDFSLSDIDITNGSSRVDANLISIEHADAILDFIATEKHSLSHDAELLFCLCFYSGLRRNEAAYLRLRDFEILEDTETKQLLINLSVRNHRERKLKSASAHRLLPLTFLWPAKVLNTLHRRLIYLNKSNKNDAQLLFNDPTEVTSAFALISNVMRDYTGDSQLRIHHLRHSFANWQYFRLMLATQKSFHTTQLPPFLQHEYLGADNSQKLKDHLGLGNNSRKTLFVLSAMLGHQDISTTLASYIHLREIFHFIHTAREGAVTQKRIDRTVGRALGNKIGKILITRSNLSEKAPEKLRRLSLEYKGKVFPKPSDLLSESQIPIFSPIENKLPPKIIIPAMAAATVLKSMESFDIQTVAIQTQIDKNWISLLYDSAVFTSQNYPRRGKKFPIFPSFPKSQAELPNNKSVSQSWDMFNYLCEKYDELIKEERISASSVGLGLDIMRFAIPGKGYLFRCPDPDVCSNFLFLSKALGLLDRHLRFKLYYPPVNSNIQSQTIQGNWSKVIINAGYSGTNISHAKVSETPYLGKKATNGTLEIIIVHTKLKSNKTMRIPVFFNFLHLILILHHMKKST